jgi:hypothetical protein
MNMTTAANQSGASSCPTPIAVLQDRWDAANAAYTFHEEAEAKCHQDERFKHRHSRTEAFKAAQILSHAVLYQQPHTWRDALILTGHAYCVVDLGEGAEKADREGLDAAMDALLAFIADNADVGPPLTGWLSDCLRYARENVAARVVPTAAKEA